MYAVQNGDFTNGEFDVLREILTLLATSVTLTDAIPERSTRAMLLVGFAGVSFTAYLRKSKAAATIYPDPRLSDFN